ncbi:hypothetical protein LF41_1324 [Lysobacter dokdonensis DS-58]|uniref:Uncharacterized protein n=1 Tax=Lysobacter dokdonensis DS-58 TaxID=1300345 RepID=A0A0A2X6C7_9GAMM|nr:hypothetical protein [Lysobacter dokdonensis]KGQ20784.1 hypothetical protein LF41_1324 [Lysobacter dokdonensis DS-58]
MNIKTLETVLDEMRKSNHADERQLRDWEARIAEAITDDLVAKIQASFGAPALAPAPGGHDWEA